MALQPRHLSLSKAVCVMAVMVVLMAVSTSASGRDLQASNGPLNLTKVLLDVRSKLANFSQTDANQTKFEQNLNKFVTNLGQSIKTKAEASQAASKVSSSVNATHISLKISNRTITFARPAKPSSFNATIPALTVKNMFGMLSDLSAIQPLVSAMTQLLSSSGASPSARSLLAEEAPADASVDPSANLASTDSAQITTMTANTDGTTSTRTTVDKKRIASRINLLMSDAWLVTYSGFNVGRACIQLLAAMIKSTATGTLTVDSTLVLQFADLASSFSASVSYLLYGIQKLTADAVAPLGLAPKPSPSPAP